jgi:hypothetical protein
VVVVVVCGCSIQSGNIEEGESDEIVGEALVKRQRKG